MSKLIDLTHPLDANASLPPGMPPPAIELVRTIATHGRNSSTFAMSVHTGTHLDSPVHVIDGGEDISSIDPARLHGPAVTAHVPLEHARGIDVDDLASVRDILQPNDALLIATGWSRFYGTDGYRGASPWLTLDAARWIVDQRVRLVGVDCKGPEAPPAPEPGGGPKGSGMGADFRVHHILLGNGVLIVENVAYPERTSGRFELWVMPVPLVGADGAPARVVAIVD